MGTWNSRGLRGSTLEDMINQTNECYLEKGLARYRGFRYALMRRNVIQTHFRCKIFMNIR